MAKFQEPLPSQHQLDILAQYRWITKVPKTRKEARAMIKMLKYKARGKA